MSKCNFLPRTIGEIWEIQLSCLVFDILAEKYKQYFGWLRLKKQSLGQNPWHMEDKSKCFLIVLFFCLVIVNKFKMKF